MRKILVSGSLSGIGKYICEELDGIALTRANHNILLEDNFDVIIHCANNRNKFPNSSEFYQYYLDNIKLTQKLVGLKHSCFIYFSTIEVYPFQDEKIWTEEEQILVSELEGVYPFSKLLSEEIVKNESQSHLILRLSSLLGKYTKPNTILKILEGNAGPYTLSEESDFNCIHYSDVLGFIKNAIEHNIRGRFNVVSDKNISLKEVAEMASLNPKFGNYTYQTGFISNKKIKTYNEAFNKTSKAVLLDFLRQDK
jgi:nucleoside-diphosphate-sugar epimerase